MAAGPKMLDSPLGYVHFGGRTVASSDYGAFASAENTCVLMHMGVFFFAEKGITHLVHQTYTME